MERLVTFIEKFLGSIAVIFHRRHWLVLGLAAMLASLGGWSSFRLSVNPDLSDLLPKSFRSVQDIAKLKERFGGVGYVVVVGMGGTPETLKKFAKDLAPRLEKVPGIRFVDYERPSKFFMDKAMYYLDLSDLQEIETRLSRRMDWERQHRNPLFIDLEDTAPPSMDISDIEAKYAGRTSTKMVGNGEDYYLDPDKRIIALLAKPSHSALDMGATARLLVECQKVVNQLDLKSYGSDFVVKYTGVYPKKVDQQNQMVKDIAVTSGIATLLLFVYLAFHFRGFVPVLLVLLPTIVGVTWTYGLVATVFMNLNIMTSFLVAILGGLGTEHGIHLIGRYASLRNEGKTSEEATREAFSHTGTSALTSALVASLTFGTLVISEFRAFKEFGVVAAGGMVVTVFAYLTVLPACFGLAARFGWNPKIGRVVAAEDSWLAGNLPRFARPLAIFCTLAVLFSFLGARYVRFNYDIAALEDASLESYQIDKEVNRILGYSQTPMAILTDSVEDEKAIVKELLARASNKDPGKRTIDFVASLSDLVPEQQLEKQAVLQKINESLSKVKEGMLPSDLRQQLRDVKRMVKAVPFVLEDVPATVRRSFQGIGKSESGFVLVFPAVSLTDGVAVKRLATDVRGIPLPSGKLISAAGDAMVLADIIDMVTRETPRIFLAAVLSALVIMWVMMASIKNALLCLVPTLASMVGLLGLMGVSGVKFNYLNIVAVPVLIGTTLDAGVHLVSRLRESRGNFRQVYGETGRAICAGLLTSGIGFAALMMADHPGLNSVGFLTVLGYSVNLFLIIVGFPSLWLWLESRRLKS